MAFLCKLCSRQVSNPNQILVLLYPWFFLGENHWIYTTRQDQKVSHMIVANLVATYLLAKWHLCKSKLRLTLLCQGNTAFSMLQMHFVLSLTLKLSILIDLICKLICKPVSTFTDTRTMAYSRFGIIHYHFYYGPAEEVLWIYHLIFNPSVWLQSLAGCCRDDDILIHFWPFFFFHFYCGHNSGLFLANGTKGPGYWEVVLSSRILLSSLPFPGMEMNSPWEVTQRRVFYLTLLY